MTGSQLGKHEAQARVVEVVDGDTYSVEMEVFADTYIGSEEEPVDVRLAHVDTAETYGEDEDSEEYKRGMKHKTFVENWIQYGVDVYDGRFPFVVRVSPDEESGSFTRFLVDQLVRKADGSELNAALLSNFDGIENRL